jgi:hypothetical protein
MLREKTSTDILNICKDGNYDYVIKCYGEAWGYYENYYFFKKDGICAIMYSNDVVPREEISLNHPITLEDLKAPVGIVAACDTGEAEIYIVKDEKLTLVDKHWCDIDIKIIKEIEERLRQLIKDGVIKWF